MPASIPVSFLKGSCFENCLQEFKCSVSALPSRSRHQGGRVNIQGVSEFLQTTPKTGNPDIKTPCPLSNPDGNKNMLTEMQIYVLYFTDLNFVTWR
jgi:hypothetical protein